MSVDVSIILPTHNRAHLLPRAINSVLNQTYTNFELIIVDDGSTDDTEELVKTFNDERIVYLKNEKNLGATASRNRGINYSKGNLIAFQDSDDEWMPEKLEKQITALNFDFGAGAAYTGYFRITNNDKRYVPDNWVNILEGNIYMELLKGNFIGTPTILLKKECLYDSGLFDEKLPRLQDWDLVLRISKKYNFKFINEPLLNAYNTEVSITSNNDAFRAAMDIIISKYREDFKKYNVLSKHLLNTGINICKFGNYATGQIYIKNAVFEKPSIKNIFAYCSSLMGKTVFLSFLNTYQHLKIKRWLK